ncbi:hypothetical protein TYRP_000264 [Tyrophagus putrescentiae]|nr:hypothetical protein TYRP_000264 [Tyrophagus putrescentiae]
MTVRPDSLIRVATSSRRSIKDSARRSRCIRDGRRYSVGGGGRGGGGFAGVAGSEEAVAAGKKLLLEAESDCESSCMLPVSRSQLKLKMTFSWRLLMRTFVAAVVEVNITGTRVVEVRVKPGSDDGGGASGGRHTGCHLVLHVCFALQRLVKDYVENVPRSIVLEEDRLLDTFHWGIPCLRFVVSSTHSYPNV